MRIIDENNVEIFDPDYTKGYTTEETIIVCHHGATYEPRGDGHWRVIKTHENGSKLVEWVNDIPPRQIAPAWDETEDILRWHWYADQEPEEEVEM